jgi:hypothetical protein
MKESVANLPHKEMDQGLGLIEIVKAGTKSRNLEARGNREDVHTAIKN